MSSLTLRLFTILLIAVAIGTINSASCPVTTITRAQYDAIQINWTRAQVTAAVGNPGNVISESASSSIVVYQGSAIGATATFEFINGVVYAKSQILLC